MNKNIIFCQRILVNKNLTRNEHLAIWTFENYLFLMQL